MVRVGRCIVLMACLPALSAERRVKGVMSLAIVRI